MKHKTIRATVCAMAMAVMFSGSLYMTEGKGKDVQAAPVVAGIMPAAGVGLVLDEGVPVSQIRDEVKKRKENTSDKTRAVSGETAAEGEAETSKEGETEIIEAVEPILKEPET